MSRIANQPVDIPANVELKLEPGVLTAKGPKGELSVTVPSQIGLVQEANQCKVDLPENAMQDKRISALAGTTRALLNNLIIGVTIGFEKKLTIIGVGYRAQAKGSTLNLSLGFSHPVVYQLPSGVSAQTPSQTEIVLSGMDKQRVGQAAAEIRSFRPPEPYKGKGVRYADEYVMRKQAKKK